jgi:hypothetical protein
VSAIEGSATTLTQTLSSIHFDKIRSTIIKFELLIDCFANVFDAFMIKDKKLLDVIVIVQ